MWQTIRKMGYGASAICVIVSIGLGVGEASASISNGYCGDDPGELGTCPPYDDDTCGDDCHQLLGSPWGQCGPTSYDGQCCICVL